MYKKILFILLIVIIPKITFGAVVSVSCGTSSHFSSDCTQCFTETTNIYVGYGARNLSDTWRAGNVGNYIYPDENKNPVNIRAFYTAGEIEKGSGGFVWSSNLSDGSQNNGELLLDGAGDTFIKFLPNTSGLILQSEPSFFIKFARVSDSIRNNGRSYPLWETQYKLNYYDIGSWTKKAHKECVLNYPSYCGDGVLEASHGEACDDGNNVDGDGCSATCQTEVNPTCNSLVANPNSGNAPLTSSFTCSATSATSYRIDIFSGSTILNTINSSVGSYTFTNTGSYTARCTINGSITSNACLASIIVGGTTPPTPNIDINKVDANPADLDGVVGNDTQTVNVGTGAIFRIRVTNNYTESLRNLVLTDAIAPNCAGSVTLPSTFPSTWTGTTVGGSGDHTNNVLEVGEYIDYVCDRSNTTAGYTNSATVTGVGVTSNQSVTDTDTTVVLIPGGGGPTCGTAGGYVLGSSESVWPVGLTFCSNSGATVNPNPPVVPAQGGSTSWTCSDTSGTITCNASRLSPGGGGGGGGGGGPSCVRISIPSLEATGAGKAISSTGSVNIQCYGNSRAMVMGVDCDSDGNGATKSISYQENSTVSGSLRVTEFTCTYNNLNTVPHPKCYVTSGGGTVTTSSTSSLTCSTGLSVGRNSCGDSVVQRPNSDGVMEECEAVNGVFPSWCIACKTTNFTIPVEGGGILTYPGGGNIYIRPFGQVIIGAGRNPFTVFGVSPLVGNDSSEDIYLNYPLCVHNSDSSVILRSNDTGLTRVCTANNIGWIYPGVSKTYESLNNGNSVNIKGVKITDNTNYKDSIITTTLGDFKDAFFAAQLKVRVSKPAVATVGGGTSLIRNSNITADINKVAGGGYSDPDKNKNFVGAGVSTGSVSSYSKSVDSTNSITKISSGQTTKTQTNLNKLTTTNVSGNKSIGDTLSKYNGLSNVFIVKNGNLTVNSSMSNLSGERTYIVEGGDLYINQNITYSDNIAFVVKGGNIIISSNVTSINGTFIAIKVGGVGGKITSAESDNKLVVNGSLYGDIESLVNNRTYIENKNNLINVGTIVSFGSNLFRKQAPLVGDFIGEYVESKKVAK